MDRRALERLAVGAPPPTPAPPIRAIERGARVRTGWPARPLPLGRASLPRTRPTPSPPPEIAIGRPRERVPPPRDLSYEPLYLLVPDERSWRSGAGIRAAVRAAERFGPTALLVDLDPGRSDLTAAANATDAEGIAEVLDFGLSLDGATIELRQGVRLVPLGNPRAGTAELYAHEAWGRLIKNARRRGLRLLAYVPPGPDLHLLAEHAGAVLLLASPEDETRLRASLPAGLPVVGAIEPPTTTEPLVFEPEPKLAPEPDAAGPSPRPVAAPASTIRSEPEAAPPPPPDESATPPAPLPAPGTEPPMRAPTARGRTLAQWLEEEEDHVRSLGEVDSVPPPRPPRPAPGPPPLEASRSDSLETPTAPPAGPGGAPTGSAPDVAIPPAASETPAPTAPPGPPDLESIDFARRATHRYSVPKTSPRAELFIRTAAVVILGYWTYYIAWRWLETLNTDALWFSVPLALAETWGWVTAFFLVFTVWKLNHRRPSPAPGGLAVDVFITTYGEPLEVIRRTTISAREIRYPHKTYVLDDGRRDEVRAMAREMGVGYITRDNNDHAKAGNLNNALRYTSGDYILQLDADHAPLPQILDHLLGFFDDRRVAFVQTPQDFYNLDSFTSHVDEETQRVWEEQKLFFSVLQPGKDFWNSAFFCGSCGVLRRKALDEIGGFSVETITEDVETSMLLHARGWRSVYYGESLAYGLAASSAAAFHIQQGRWAQGSMQILRRFNPITLRGLSIAQRIGYFYSLSSFAGGLQKLIFYGAPIVFFFTGVLPIRALDSEFLVRFLPYLLLSILLYELLARGLGFTWIAERYQMAKFWTYTRALPTYLTKRRVRFQVTPKGPTHVPFRTYAPHIALMIVTVVAVYFAVFAYDRGWVAYPVPGWRSLAFQANFTWALLNFVLAAYVVRLSIRLQHQRQDHRFSDRFPIYLQPRSRQGTLGEQQLALTENLNIHGVSFRSVSEFELGTILKMTLPLSTREITLDGTVVHVRAEREPSVPAFIHGIEFRNVSLEVRDAIEIHCTHHAVPFRQLQYSPASSVTASRGPLDRGERRSTVRLPAWVLLGDEAGESRRAQNVAFLEEIGPSGASLIMNEPVPPETPIVFEVPGTDIRGEGHTTYSHALETPIGVRFVVGVSTRGADEVVTGSRFSVRSFLAGGRRAGIAILVGLTALAASPRPAEAQFLSFGTAEMDSRDYSLLLLGASLQASAPSGMGLFASVTAYRLLHPGETERVTVDGLAPSVGVIRAAGSTAMQLGVGYLVLATEEVAAIGAPAGAGEGILVSGSVDHQGPPIRAQLNGSYNFGDEYLWTRARGSRLISLDFGAGRAAAGAEVVFQGGGAGDGFHSFQFGPTLEIPVSPSFRLLAATGWKSDDLPQTRGGGFPYYKLEFGYAAGAFDR